VEKSCPSTWRTAVRRDGEALSAYEEFLLSLDTNGVPMASKSTGDRYVVGYIGA
jgi:hypothetical protein